MLTTESKFTKALVKRLKVRAGKAGEKVWVLDLRHHLFGNQVPRYVRCPDDTGWPEQGRTTAKKEEAEEWVRRHYAPRLFREMTLANSVPNSSQMTFAMAAKAYITARLKEVGPGGVPKLQSRVSMLEHHVVPALGHLPMNAITGVMVRERAMAMKVERFVEQGVTSSGPAALGTKRNFVRATAAVWHHTFPGVACPWAGIKLSDPEAAEARRRAIDEGHLEELLRPSGGALDREELLRALTGAMHYDKKMGSQPKVAATMVPNTAHAMAIQTGLGLRVAEALNLRWGHINFADGYVLVGGTKTRNALRLVPLQRQLLPWLQELKQSLGKECDPRAFVLRTNAKASVLERGSTAALGSRYAWALKYAGLKHPKKRTHWARATHATWGQLSKAVRLEDLKRYLGHSGAYGGSTDSYIDQLRKMMVPEHRTYISGIPTPKKVRTALKSFEPHELPPWRTRRQVFGRTKADIAARQARARARVPMTKRYLP